MSYIFDGFVYYATSYFVYICYFFSLKLYDDGSTEKTLVKTMLIVGVIFLCLSHTIYSTKHLLPADYLHSVRVFFHVYDIALELAFLMVIFYLFFTVKERPAMLYMLMPIATIGPVLNAVRIYERFYLGIEVKSVYISLFSDSLAVAGFCIVVLPGLSRKIKQKYQYLLSRGCGKWKLN